MKAYGLVAKYLTEEELDKVFAEYESLRHRKDLAHHEKIKPLSDALWLASHRMGKSTNNGKSNSI